MYMDMKREYWVDNIKLFACVLVALGHLTQSMCQSGIVAECAFLRWFEQTIYYFHVPLFFVCSGYLYQNRKEVNCWTQWKNHAKEKLVSLGIPYVTFSLVTWILKTAFSGSVNSQANSLLYDLLIHPQSPYWYLFALLFIFLLIPTFTNERVAFTVLCVAILIRVLPVAKNIYVIKIVLDNCVWFVAGILLSLLDFRTFAIGRIKLGFALAIAFVIISIVTWHLGINIDVINFAMGVLACFAVCILCCEMGTQSYSVAKYTMPIYLMHTIFAAGLRSVLLAIGIKNDFIHICTGLLASFACPIIAMKIMETFKMDFFVYPWKCIHNTQDKK